jgi:3-hydroxybutyryl-CoA dehydrogenase
MNLSDVDRIAVVGAGQMGGGITQVAAQAGYPVTVRDIEPDYVDRGLETIEGNLDRAVEKDRIDADDRDAIRDRITGTTDLKDAADADVVVEAVPEEEDLKSQVWSDLHEVCPPETVFASNTSTISITRLAEASGRPERFVGMHFFNPVPVMDLVEVIRGERTPDELAGLAVDLAEDLGKTPVEVEDFPGFASNRILLPMVNEAIFALQEGVADKEGIDTVMKLGMNHPMGPLRLADLIGLDTCLHVLEVLHADLGDDKYRPAPLLRRKVDAGLLGEKTGEGFYTYD